MNYKHELERYLNNSRSKAIDDSDISISRVVGNTKAADISSFIQTTALSESTILPSHKYNKVIQECLNFEDIDTKKVKFVYILRTTILRNTCQKVALSQIIRLGSINRAIMLTQSTFSK
jgi:hypothetical protein